MAPNITTDTATIAKHISSACYGSSSTGTGSFYNPRALTDNCVFVSLAYVLRSTAPELSRVLRVCQPKNGSGGIEADVIVRLMDRAKILGLVDKFVESDVPFDYGVENRMGDSLLSLVFYYTGPPRPDGRRPGHCVVGHAWNSIADYQHLRDRGSVDADYAVTHKVYPNGYQDTNSIACTILVKPGAMAHTVKATGELVNWPG